MTYLILETGKVKLRCGYEARVHATNLSGDRPVLLSYLMPDKGWFALFSLQDGRQLSGGVDHQFDLVPISQPQYFNIYTRKDGTTFAGIMSEGVESSLHLGDMTIDMADGGTFETFRYCNNTITKVESGEHE